MGGNVLFVPLGKARGCLPRRSRFGEVCLAFSDAIEVIPRDRWSELIGRVNLRPSVRVIFDQGNIGSCATESTTQAAMIGREVAGAPFVLLNPWSIYRITSGGRDGGSSIDANLQFARDVGILPEEYWPRSKGWRATPPDGWEQVASQYRVSEFYDVRNGEEVGSALLTGFAVVFGWSGHSCILTSLLSPTVAEYCNSWDESWGDRGFGRIKLRNINFGYGAWALRCMRAN